MSYIIYNKNSKSFLLEDRDTIKTFRTKIEATDYLYKLDYHFHDICDIIKVKKYEDDTNRELVFLVLFIAILLTSIVGCGIFMIALQNR